MTRSSIVRCGIPIACWVAGVVAPSPGRVAPGATTAADHTVVGRVEEHTVPGSGAIGPRRVWVLLPSDYDAGRRYPVVYAQDGQDLFDAATAAGGEEWALDELLAARPPGIPELIVVGIEAAPEALRDFAPPGSAEGARGDEYVRFMVDAVKPLVDAAYSTRSDREDTVLLGEGAGAVIALYAAWRRPDLFGGAIAIELPDLDRESLEFTARAPATHRPRLWIEQSGGDAAVRPSGTAMLEALRRSAEVEYVIGTRATTRVALCAAGLRALFNR